MSRSKHTDPKAIRAARRIRAPREGRGVSDLSQRRELGRELKKIGTATGQKDCGQKGHAPLPFIVKKPRRGFHHPVGKRDVFEMLTAVGPVAFYGLRSVELTRASTNASTLVLGQYRVPGRIILFEQPIAPWRLVGSLKSGVIRRLD